MIPRTLTERYSKSEIYSFSFSYRLPQEALRHLKCSSSVRRICIHFKINGISLFWHRANRLIAQRSAAAVIKQQCEEMFWCAQVQKKRDVRNDKLPLPCIFYLFIFSVALGVLRACGLRFAIFAWLFQPTGIDGTKTNCGVCCFLLCFVTRARRGRW